MGTGFTVIFGMVILIFLTIAMPMSMSHVNELVKKCLHYIPIREYND